MGLVNSLVSISKAKLMGWDYVSVLNDFSKLFQKLFFKDFRQQRNSYIGLYEVNSIGGLPCFVITIISEIFQCCGTRFSSKQAFIINISFLMAFSGRSFTI